MKKYSKISILLLSAALFSLPLRAFAQGFGVVSEAVAWIIRGIGYLFNVIAGLFLTLAASLADFTLGFNIKHLSADALNADGSLVRVGWELSRNIANLGFVLAIVIIAFATIIQYKSYGAKKFLPKLVAAAVIVNFSMAIAVPIVGFSNTITKFFLADQLGASWGDNIKLSQTIADSFGPQKLILGETEDEGPLPPETTEGGGAFSGFGKALVLATASAIFSVVFTTIATIVFAALAFMLLIRYVWLTFLLILAPVAWLVWVIPGLENLFSKWWSNFFKWSLFAPAVSFFIYLALVGGKLLEGGEAVNTVRGNFSGNLQDIMAQGAEMIILAGLMLGGLIAANNLSIHGAKGAIGIANKMGNQTKTWAARKGRQWASRPVRGKYKLKGETEGKSLTERTQTWASQGGLKGMIGRTFVQPAADLSTAGGEKVLKEHDATVKNLTTAQAQAALATTVSIPRKVALLKKLAGEGKLGDDDVRRYVTTTTRDRFARFGQESEFKKITKKTGMTPEMNAALIQNNTEALKESSEKYVKGMSKGDAKEAPWDKIFKSVNQGKGALGFDKDKTDEFATNLTRGLASQNPSLVFSIIPTLDSQALESFEQKYGAAIDEEMKKADPASDIYNRLDGIKKGFEKSIAKHVFGEAPRAETKEDEKKA